MVQILAFFNRLLYSSTIILFSFFFGSGTPGTESFLITIPISTGHFSIIAWPIFVGRGKRGREGGREGKERGKRERERERGRGKRGRKREHREERERKTEVEGERRENTSKKTVKKIISKSSQHTTNIAW